MLLAPLLQGHKITITVNQTIIECNCGGSRIDIALRLIQSSRIVFSSGILYTELRLILRDNYADNKIKTSLAELNKN